MGIQDGPSCPVNYSQMFNVLLADRREHAVFSISFVSISLSLLRFQAQLEALEIFEETNFMQMAFLSVPCFALPQIHNYTVVFIKS